MSEALTRKQQICKSVCAYEKKKRETDPEWYKKKTDRARKWLNEKYMNDPEFREKAKERTKLNYQKKLEAKRLIDCMPTTPRVIVMSSC